MSKRKRISISEALELVPDNMGEMAQIAVAAEMAGIDFADAFDALADDARPIPPSPWKTRRANDDRKRLKKAGLAVKEFVETHWRVDGVADIWPTSGRWKMLDGSAKGLRGAAELIKHLRKKCKP